MKKSLLISACLYGQKCRYDGKDNKADGLLALSKHFNLVPVCPEVLGGLSTPRNPSEISGGRVIMNNGADVTQEYNRGARAALEIAMQNDCKEALMKEKSPSCASEQIYDGTFTRTLKAGEGVTVKLLRQHGIRVFNENQINELMETIKE